MIERPIAIVVVSALLAIAGATFAWRSLALDADTNSLIGSDRPFMQLYQSFLDEFGDLERLYVVVDAAPDGGSPDESSTAAARGAVDLLLEKLRATPDLPEVHGRIDAHEQWALATRSMATEDLEGLADAERTLSSLAAGDAAGAIRIAARDLQTLRSRGLLLSDEERRTLASGAIAAVETALAAGELPPETSLARTLEPRLITSESGRLHFVAILPEKNYNRLDAIREPLARIREVLDEVNRAFPSVEIGLTGRPVLSADELSTTDRDMIRAASIAGAMIAVLFMVVFRGVVRPLMAILAFAFAFGWTYGVATLLVGHLNLLSIVFMLVLVGVGVDYGVHVVTRYTEARRRRLSAGAIRVVMRTAAPANATGALTSSAVFLLALFTRFEGLRELGLIAGVGLLLCLVAMTIDLPALLHLAERRGRRRDPRPKVSPLDPHETVARRRPIGPWPDAILVGAIVLLGIGGAVLAATNLRFETNLLNLQAEDLDSVAWEHRVFQDSTSASWFGAIVADDLEEVRRIVDAAADHPEIARATSVLDLAPAPDERRDAARQRLREAITAPRPSGAAEGDRGAIAELDAAGIELERLAAAARATAPSESARFERLGRETRSLAAELGAAPDGPRRLDAAFRAAADNLAAMTEGDRAPLRDALPSALRDEMIAPSGRFLVRLLPSEDVWEPEPLERFVAAMREIDPDATGVPMTVLESTRDMSRAFTTMASLSLAVVLILVWIDFRSIAATAICTASLLLGIAWTVGAMAAFGIPLNLANFFGIPILIGLGIDSGVHMVHRARESRGGRIRFGGTARAVMLTAATTAVGFGCLIFAAHRGLQSLGMVMLIGSGACAVVALLAVPALVRLAGWERPRSESPAV